MTIYTCIKLLWGTLSIYTMSCVNSTSISLEKINANSKKSANVSFNFLFP